MAGSFLKNFVRFISHVLSFVMSFPTTCVRGRHPGNPESVSVFWDNPHNTKSPVTRALHSQQGLLRADDHTDTAASEPPEPGDPASGLTPTASTVRRCKMAHTSPVSNHDLDRAAQDEMETIRLDSNTERRIEDGECTSHVTSDRIMIYQCIATAQIAFMLGLRNVEHLTLTIEQRCVHAARMLAGICREGTDYLDYDNVKNTIVTNDDLLGHPQLLAHRVHAGCH